jgi:hypothetical protein
VRIPGSSITPIVADPPPPPRLTEQLLPIRGDVPWHELNAARYSCRRFGTNYVLTGISVRHRVTSLIGLNLYCAPLRADGTLGTNVFLPALNSSGGTLQNAVCPAGNTVVGYQGTLDPSDNLKPIRSLLIHCSPITTLGLSSGTSPSRAAAGIQSGTAWGPDVCGQSRPASGIRAAHGHIDALANPMVASIQLTCEQPQRPSR